MSSVRPSFSCKGTRGKMRFRGPHHTVPQETELQSMLGQDVPDAHQASPSSSGLYCPWLLPLRLLPDAHLIYSSTFCSILCLYHTPHLQQYLLLYPLSLPRNSDACHLLYCPMPLLLC